MPKKAPLHRSVMDELFPPRQSKSQERKIQILEAAIKSYTTDGVEKTTPGRIAELCKISRPLVLHYFPDSGMLFEVVVKYIRARFQELAIQAIQAKTAPTEQLTAYVDSTFEWAETSPRHAKVWLLFFYYCSIQPKHHALHSELVSMGHQRIQALLEQGCQEGEFKCGNPRVAAKMIQVAISGALLAVLTETSPIMPRQLRAETLRVCLAQAGAKRGATKG